MWRSAVNVVPVRVLIEDEHADVRHGAQIDEIDDLVFEEALIDERVRQVLDNGYREDTRRHSMRDRRRTNAYRRPGK